MYKHLSSAFFLFSLCIFFSVSCSQQKSDTTGLKISLANSFVSRSDGLCGIESLDDWAVQSFYVRVWGSSLGTNYSGVKVDVGETSCASDLPPVIIPHDLHKNLIIEVVADGFNTKTGTTGKPHPFLVGRKGIPDITSLPQNTADGVTTVNVGVVTLYPAGVVSANLFPEYHMGSIPGDVQAFAVKDPRLDVLGINSEISVNYFQAEKLPGSVQGTGSRFRYHDWRWRYSAVLPVGGYYIDAFSPDFSTVLAHAKKSFWVEIGRHQDFQLPMRTFSDIKGVQSLNVEVLSDLNSNSTQCDGSAATSTTAGDSWMPSHHIYDIKLWAEQFGSENNVDIIENFGHFENARVKLNVSPLVANEQECRVGFIKLPDYNTYNLSPSITMNIGVSNDESWWYQPDFVGHENACYQLNGVGVNNFDYYETANDDGIRGGLGLAIFTPTPRQCLVRVTAILEYWDMYANGWVTLPLHAVTAALIGDPHGPILGGSGKEQLLVKVFSYETNKQNDGNGGYCQGDYQCSTDQKCQNGYCVPRNNGDFGAASHGGSHGICDNSELFAMQGNITPASDPFICCTQQLGGQWVDGKFCANFDGAPFNCFPSNSSEFQPPQCCEYQHGTWDPLANGGLGGCTYLSGTTTCDPQVDDVCCQEKGGTWDPNKPQGQQCIFPQPCTDPQATMECCAQQGGQWFGANAIGNQCVFPQPCDPQVDDVCCQEKGGTWDPNKPQGQQCIFPQPCTDPQATMECCTQQGGQWFGANAVGNQCVFQQQCDPMIDDICCENKGGTWKQNALGVWYCDFGSTTLDCSETSPDYNTAVCCMQRGGIWKLGADNMYFCDMSTGSYSCDPMAANFDPAKCCQDSGGVWLQDATGKWYCQHEQQVNCVPESFDYQTPFCCEQRGGVWTSGADGNSYCSEISCDPQSALFNPAFCCEREGGVWSEGADGNWYCKFPEVYSCDNTQPNYNPVFCCQIQDANHSPEFCCQLEGGTWTQGTDSNWFCDKGTVNICDPQSAQFDPAFCCYKDGGNWVVDSNGQGHCEPQTQFTCDNTQTNYNPYYCCQIQDVNHTPEFCCQLDGGTWTQGIDGWFCKKDYNPCDVNSTSYNPMLCCELNGGAWKQGADGKGYCDTNPSADICDPSSQYFDPAACCQLHGGTLKLGEDGKYYCDFGGTGGVCDQQSPQFDPAACCAQFGGVWKPDANGQYFCDLGRKYCDATSSEYDPVKCCEMKGGVWIPDSSGGSTDGGTGVTNDPTQPPSDNLGGYCSYQNECDPNQDVQCCMSQGGAPKYQGESWWCEFPQHCDPYADKLCCENQGGYWVSDSMGNHCEWQNNNCDPNRDSNCCYQKGGNWKCQSNQCWCDYGNSGNGDNGREDLMSGVLTPHRFGLFNNLELYAIDPAGNLKDFTGDVELSLPIQHYDIWKQICMPTVVQLNRGLATLPMGISLPDNNTLPNRLIPTEIIAMSLVSTSPLTGAEPIVIFPNENTGNVVGVHQFDQWENHSTRNNQCLSTSGDSFFDVFFSLNTSWDGRDVSLSQDNRKFVFEFDENTLPFVIPSQEGFQFSIPNGRHPLGWAHTGIELGNYRSDDGRWIEGNVLIREIGLGPQHFLGSFKLCFYANGSRYY